MFYYQNNHSGILERQNMTFVLFWIEYREINDLTPDTLFICSVTSRIKYEAKRNKRVSKNYAKILLITFYKQVI